MTTEKIIESIESGVTLLKERLSKVSKVLIDREDYDDGDDCIYDMPIIIGVSKYGYSIEYCILSIDKGNIVCGGIGEDSGDIKTFTLEDLQIDEILSLGEEIL